MFQLEAQHVSACEAQHVSACEAQHVSACEAQHVSERPLHPPLRTTTTSVARPCGPRKANRLLWPPQDHTCQR